MSNPDPHITVNPDPRLTALVDMAIDEIVKRLSRPEDFEDWIAWAASWRVGRRSPAACVQAAYSVEASNGLPVSHTLMQIAWAGKEACYSVDVSPWLVIRYVADAMVAFGVPFPEGRGLLSPAQEAITR